MKAVTRREFIFDVFSRDTLKSIAGAYREFNQARSDANKISSCDEAGLILWKKKSKQNLAKNNMNIRKEG